MGIEKGAHVRVTSHEFDTTPDGTPNTGYGYGVTGTVVGFRTNRFAGRMAVVHLDHEDAYVDWAVTDIEVVDQD